VDFEAARRRMVERQIASRGVRDPRVLDALGAIPRHLFVPGEARHDAYADRALPIPEGQTISQPYMVALMTEALAPAAHHRVLEIGTGSGYQAAVLSGLCAAVFTIERHPALAALARTTLDLIGASNVLIEVGDGTEGLPQYAPFDRVIVTAGAPSVPGALLAQLAPGGRLVIPLGPPVFQHLTRIDERDGRFDRTESTACVFVPLIGRAGWPPDAASGTSM
jgi:protein-L-isoaspartate(D-aspartate) O-methyltransferase